VKTSQTITELIPGPAGALEVAHLPASPVIPERGIALIAHPHPLMGGTMDNKVAVTLAKTFHHLGYATMRFNFRGVGRSAGAFDEGTGETDDAQAALDYATRVYGGERLVLAGFSFGTFVLTRLAQRLGDAGDARQLERLVLTGPAVNRFTLDPVPADTLVIHGEEDDVVPLAAVLTWARPQQLPVVVFPGCGHFFHGRLTQLQHVITGMWRA
jgi:alpha/beta superfamily hydrolase